MENELNVIKYLRESEFEKALQKALHLDVVIRQGRSNKYIGIPMLEYDVEEWIEYDRKNDIVKVEFNYGNAKLQFENFSKHISPFDIDGKPCDWENFWDVLGDDEWIEFLDKVDDEWRDCFEY